MPHCEPNHDLLLDDLYGLLDASDRQALHAHLALCPTCQAAAAEVQQQFQLLARAARVLDQVPEFVRPGMTPVAPVAELTAAASAAAPMSLPLTTALPRRRFRLAVPLALAASILLALGGWLFYEQGRALRAENLQARQQEQKQLEARLSTLRQTYERDQQTLAKQPATAVHLQVTGPQQLSAAAHSAVQIATHDLDGQPLPSQLTVALKGAADGKELHRQEVPNRTGTTQVELPPVAVAAQLVVESKTAAAQGRLEEALTSAPPAVIPQLTTNQNVYQSDETLAFRALALERDRLAPLAQPVPVKVELLDAAGTSVAKSEGTTDTGGNYAGTLPLAGRQLDGRYTLRAAAARQEGSAATQSVEISRGGNAEPAFDREQYRPGDQVTLSFPRANHSNLEVREVKINGAAVPLSQEPQRAYGPGYTGQAKKAGEREVIGDQKNDQRGQGYDARNSGLRFTLPKNLPNNSVPADITVTENGVRQTLRRSIPLATTAPVVDFFPEGGDLVAGVVNRVYYRIRSDARSAEPLAGRVVVRSKQGVLYTAQEDQSAGTFEFTPDMAETYTAQLISAQGQTNLAAPFARLGIQRAGVVLQAVRSVGKQGEPIELVLRNVGPARRLLLVAECRGRLVGESWVELKTEAQTVALQPTRDAHGLLQVTAYEAVGAALLPRAERLVYRAPAQELRFEMPLDRQTARQNEAVQGKITVRTEAGRPATGWVLAAIVEEQHALPVANLAAYFEAAQAQQLDREEFAALLSRTPPDAEALDLLLGTQGWRRFTRVEPLAVAAAPTTAPVPTNLAPVAAPALFSRENASLDRLRQQARAAQETARAALEADFQRGQRELSSEQQAAAEAVRSARAILQLYEAEPRILAQTALGILTLALLVLGVIALGFGVVQVLRQRPATTPLAGAFACLLLCCGITAVATFTTPPSANESSTGPLAAVNLDKRAHDEAAPRQADALAKDRSPQVGTPIGVFALRPESSKEPTRSEQDVLQQATRMLRDEAARARDGQMRTALADRAFGGGGFKQENNRGNYQLPTRPGLEAANAPAALGGAAAVPQASTAPAALPNPGFSQEKGQQGSEGKNCAREMAAQYGLRASTGTLLWQPALVLADGSVTLRFETARRPGIYRIVLLGHDAEGRLGSYEGRLEVAPAEAGSR